MPGPRTLELQPTCAAMARAWRWHRPRRRQTGRCAAAMCVVAGCLARMRAGLPPHGRAARTLQLHSGTVRWGPDGSMRYWIARLIAPICMSERTRCRAAKGAGSRAGGVLACWPTCRSASDHARILGIPSAARICRSTIGSRYLSSNQPICASGARGGRLAAGARHDDDPAGPPAQGLHNT